MANGSTGSGGGGRAGRGRATPAAQRTPRRQIIPDSADNPF